MLGIKLHNTVKPEKEAEFSLLHDYNLRLVIIHFALSIRPHSLVIGPTMKLCKDLIKRERKSSQVNLC